MRYTPEVLLTLHRTFCPPISCSAHLIGIPSVTNISLYILARHTEIGSPHGVYALSRPWTMHSRLGVSTGFRLPSHFHSLNTRSGLPQNIPSSSCGRSPRVVHPPLSSPSFCTRIDGVLAIMGIELKVISHSLYPMSLQFSLSLSARWEAGSVGALRGDLLPCICILFVSPQTNIIV